jgi:hypothetical protein
VLPASSMADAAFAMQGNVGTMVQQDGGALLRISQALYGLMGSLTSSLGELRDVGNMLEQEIAAGSPDEPQGSVSVDVRPQLLLVVAGVLKEMVGTLVSDIKGNAEVQKLLPAIQKTSMTSSKTWRSQSSPLKMTVRPVYSTFHLLVEKCRCPLPGMVSQRQENL